MREWSVSHIVQENSQHGCGGLCIGDINVFLLENRDGFVHEVHRSQRVQQARVHGAGIDKKTQSELTDTGQALQIGVLQYMIQHSIGNVEKTKYGVIDDLARGSHKLQTC